jgi:hypothetical protein
MVLDDSGDPVRDPDGFVRYESTTIAMPDGTSRETVAGLRTTDGVSEVVTSGQVLGSIIMFGLIYLLLGTLWIFVLNSKIQHGPDPPAPAKSGDGMIVARGPLVEDSGAASGTGGAQ